MINLRVQTGSTLSNVDIIKLHLYFEGNSSAEELAAEVSRLMRSAPDAEKALKVYVLPVLERGDIFVKKGRKYAINLDVLPEHQIATQVFEETRKFLSEKDIRSKIAKSLGIKVSTVAFSPEKIKGLKKIGKRWGLKNWKIINDEAYEMLVEQKASLSEKGIVKMVVDAGLASADTAIFDPIGDKRFKRDRKNWRAVSKDEAAKAKTVVKSRSKAKTSVDRKLESDFMKAQASKDAARTQPKRDSSDKLKRVLIKKIVTEKIKESHPDQVIASPSSDRLAERFKDIFNEEKQEVSLKEDFEKMMSYQHVEDVPRESGLSQKERLAINTFLKRLASAEDIVPLSNHPVNLSGPLSAPKVERILYQRYADYSLQRILVPDEYNRLLVELLDPKIPNLVLNPAMQVGNLAVAVLNYLYEEMNGMFWALGDKDSLQLVNRHGEKLTLDARGTPLVEKIKEEFVLNRNELLNNFIEYNFCGLDNDPVLTQTAKVMTRLSGFENVYLVCRDFLTELPEVFGQPPNPENDIDLLFDVILGNITFKNNHNIVANFMDQATRILAANGRIGFFLTWDFLRLMDGHEFLDMIRSRHYFDIVLHLSGIPDDSEAALVVLRPRDSEDSPPIRFGNIASSTEIHRCLSHLKSGGATDAITLIPQEAFSQVFL